MTKMNELNELLVRNNCVLALALEMQERTLKYNLSMTLADSESPSARQVVLYFHDVSNLNLSEIGGGLTQFMHLEISLLNPSFDRAIYLLNELEDGKISFNFFAVDLKN